MALYTLAPQPWLIFLDDSGLYLPNGQLAIYQAGTSTPAVVYADANGTPHPFPITLDSAGRVPGGLYLQPGQNYKFVLHAPQVEEPLDGGIIKTQDNVQATPHSGGSLLVLNTPGDYHDLNVAGVTMIEYTGADHVFIRGMVGGVVGQSILIRNLTPFIVWLYSTDPAAPPGASMLNFIAAGPTPLAALRGSARYTYVSAGAWLLETHSQGVPIRLPFSAGAYSTESAAIWTVEEADVISETFYVQGRVMMYSFGFNDTSLSAPTAYLARLIPFGWQIGAVTSTNIVLRIGANPTEVGMVLGISPTQIGFQRVPTADWPASTNGLDIVGQIFISLD